MERRNIVIGHPMVKQGWANGDNVRARGVGMIRVGALTGGERAPAGDEGGPARGGGAGGGAQRWAPKSSVITSLLATDVSAERSG